MEKQDFIDEFLEKISRKGDLYDAVALKKHVQPKSNYFLRTNLFIFSRILYGGLLLWDYLRARKAPIEEIKKGTDKVRETLGFNIDIVRIRDFRKDIFKFFLRKSYLALLYVEENESLETFRDNIKRLQEFLDIYNIDEVCIKSKVLDKFPVKNLWYHSISMRSFLGMPAARKYDNDNPELNEEYYVFNKDILRSLIAELEKLVIDVDFNLMEKLVVKADDLVISMAMQDFIKNYNIQELTDTVLGRLSLRLNNENTYRHRLHGKVFEKVTILDDYIKSEITSASGQKIDASVRSLYDYFGVSDFDDLLNRLEFDTENPENLAIGGLYLYLYTLVDKKPQKFGHTLSFYDKIYDCYHDKSQKVIKGLYTPKELRDLNLPNSILSWLFAYVLIFVILIVAVGSSLTFDTVYSLITHDYIYTADDCLEVISTPYRYSWNLEAKIIDRLIPEPAKEFINKIKGDFEGFLEGNSKIDLGAGSGESAKLTDSGNLTDGLFSKSSQGNSVESLKSSGEETLAKVNILNDYMFAPTYYATKYASSAVYQDGELIYNLNSSMVDIEKIEDLEPLFSVSIEMSQNALYDMFCGDSINFVQTLYPLGYNFVITKIEIKDKNDPNNYFFIDADRVKDSADCITYNEVCDLLDMERPIITYTYGANKNASNSFISSMEKTGSYNDLDFDVAKQTIIKSLGLNDDASLEEIYWAIANKNYSINPFKDSGLTESIKNLSEYDYLNTLASLDGLNRSLAVTLLVEADDELIYTTGYTCDEDGNITMSNGTAWATTPDGDIINPTPRTASPEEAAQNVLLYGLANKIPLAIVLILLGAIFKKLFGKKITFKLNVNRVKKLVNSTDIEDAYSQIKNVYYGGINVPLKEKPVEFVKTIRDEFYALTKEELEELLKKLQETKDRQAMALAKEIPFIVQNHNTLKRVLSPKNDHNIFEK